MEAVVERCLADTPVQQAIDKLEAGMLASDFEPVELPLRHTFTPGLYTRTIFMPAGTLLTSKVHRTEHPYVIVQGQARVFIEETGEVQVLTAPYMGITKPGTRRVLFITQDCIWSTFHPISEEEQGDLEKIEARLIEPRLIEGVDLHKLYLEKLSDQALLEVSV